MKLIDADELENIYRGWLPQLTREEDAGDRNGVETCIAVLQDAPTINAEPVVHGKWIYDHWCEFKCSNCGHWSDSKPYKGRENYCPNCGAKMDGGTLCE